MINSIIKDNTMYHSCEPGYMCQGIYLGLGSVNNTIQGNILSGEVRYAYIIEAAQDNAFIGNDSSGLHAITTTSNQLEIRNGFGLPATGNLFTENIFGTTSGISVVDIHSYFGGKVQNNIFLNNDYSHTGKRGLKFGDEICVSLSPGTENNLIRENGGFPPGTGGSRFQVVDLGILNRVVGHRANEIAHQEDINPGIGQRLKEAENALEDLIP
jgi:hypothetical protein